MKKKFYAVVWTRAGARRYGGVPGDNTVISPISDVEDCIVRDKRGTAIDAPAIFFRKCDAETWRDKNPDFVTIRVSIKEVKP